MKALSQMRSLLDVLRLNASAFHRATCLLEEIRGRITIAGELPGLSMGTPIQKSSKTKLSRDIKSLRDSVECLDIPLSRLSIDRLLKKMRSPDFSYDKLEGHLNDIHSRMNDELENISLFAIVTQSIKYYDGAAPLFGQEVVEKWPMLQFDIEEAGKCFAVQRYTATVFHLMRVMERVVQDTGNSVGATVKDQHDRYLPWGIIVKNMKEKIDKMPKGDEQEKWYRTQALLENVNRAWRTATMHPKMTYTHEEAEEIFSTVRGFTRSLATF